MVRESCRVAQRIWGVNFLQPDVTRRHSFALMHIRLLFAAAGRTLL
jgi:hypothetical protein